MLNPRTAAATLIVLAVALTGCGSEAQKLADGGAKTAACSAISSIDKKLASAEDASPEELDKLKTQAQAAQKALETAGDKVPESLQSQVDAATKKLEDAADSAKSSGEADKEKVKDAADELSSSLKTASDDLNC